jgi:aminoglycoside phosphotransferase (APT) family kinase protein
MTVDGRRATAHIVEALGALVARLGVGELEGVERLSGGVNMETYRVRLADGSRLALRRAPDAVVAFADVGGGPATGGGLAAEGTLLQAARQAGVPVPAVVHELEPADGLGAGLLVEWLDGETLGRRIVRSEHLADVRPGLARQCGRALARLHRINPHLLGDVLPVVSPEELVRTTWSRYQNYGAAEPMIDYSARWLLDHLPSARPPAVVHGDFRNGNLVISATGGLVGVLDWELAHLGDPMRDLGWLCTGSWRFGRHDLACGGFGTREELFAGYEAETGRPVDPDDVRFWEVFGSFWWAVGCVTMAHVYRAGGDRSVERLVIGRRSSECQWDCVQLLLGGPAGPAAAQPDLHRDPHSDVAAGPPSVGELLAAVAEFLRDEVAATADPRTGYLAKVSANALDIARRQIAAPRDPTDRVALCAGLRSGELALDAPGLADYLQSSVTAQLALDNPGYGAARE